MEATAIILGILFTTSSIWGMLTSECDKQRKEFFILFLITLTITIYIWLK
jgi:hypothetical protein